MKRAESEPNLLEEIEYFYLDVIISVGYCVRSQRGTEFRIALR